MKILVIGDSISIGYMPRLQTALADIGEVVHSPGNGGDSVNVRGNLVDWLAQERPHAVVLNCGLHDLKREKGTAHHQVSLDNYRANLEAIYDHLGLADCRVFWVTTTPVIDERHQEAKPFDRYNADVVEYNALGRAIAEDHEVAIIDLYAAARELDLESALGPDGVHFTDEAYEQLGDIVAEAVRDHLT
jgi:lysophospholipase L1-like esterase